MRRFHACLLALLLSTEVYAAGFAVRIGPPATGQGGPNPITFSPVELQLQYISRQNIESSLSITGALVGKRHTFSNKAYISIGGGLVISANGSGLGVYSAFGADFFCGYVCMTAEFQQAIGVSQNLVSPYAVRLGVTKWF